MSIVRILSLYFKKHVRCIVTNEIQISSIKSPDKRSDSHDDSGVHIDKAANREKCQERKENLTKK